MAGQLSYVCGVKAKPFMYCTIPDILLERSKKMPNTEAFIHYKPDYTRESITYATLHDRSVRIAEYLINWGVQKGDTIALMGPNTINRLIGEFGIIMAGGIVLNVSPTFKDTSDIRELLSVRNSTCFLVDQGEENVSNPIIDKLLEQTAVHQMANCREIIFLRFSGKYASYPTWDWNDPPKCINTLMPSLQPEEPVVIFSSSGSTGKPKLIEHTHFNLINQNLRHVIGGGEAVNIYYNDRPFGWAGGSPSVSESSSYTRIFVDAKMGLKKEYARTIWEIISKERCEYAFLMPYIVTDLALQRKEIQSAFQLKGLVLSGQQITDQLIQHSTWMSEGIIVPYGASETMFISTTKCIQKGDTYLTGCVGYPLPGTEIKITNEDGTTLARGQSGEIYVRSSFNARNYVDNLKATSHAYTEHGWFKTGDVGMISSDGQLWISGRLCFRISRGTRKISPEAIEFKILQMTGIQNAIVVPVPDERLLEEVCVCFVSMQGHNIQPEDVEEFCHKTFSESLALDGIGDRPKYFLSFDTLPMLSTGKPDRNVLRKKAEQYLMKINTTE